MYVICFYSLSLCKTNISISISEKKKIENEAQKDEMSDLDNTARGKAKINPKSSKFQNLLSILCVTVSYSLLTYLNIFFSLNDI